MESKHFNNVLDEKLIELLRVYKLLKKNAVKENVWKEIAFDLGKSGKLKILFNVL
jgi:hypothetical protein